MGVADYGDFHREFSFYGRKAIRHNGNKGLGSRDPGSGNKSPRHNGNKGWESISIEQINIRPLKFFPTER
jgi:hypothetical protein